MSNLGMGAMLHHLSGASEHNPDEYYGKTIAEAAISEEEVNLRFDDGVSIKIFDDAQS